jgi:arylsulfatase A-like enzyme
VLVLAACLAVAGCERGELRSRVAADNLLLVSFDTTRADRLSPYGYRPDVSPRLSQLASGGVVFERAFTHVPSTLAAHSSLMTGLLPPVHGVRCNGKFKLADAHVTLAEILSEEGFATGAVVGAFPIAARFGLAQGFASYDDDFSTSAVTARRRKGRMDSPGFWIGHDYLDFERGADEVTDRAIAWLESAGGASERWFLFAHYFDPHWPYEPVPEYAQRFDDPYDAEIAYADHHLGRLLDAVTALPGRTLVVFTADHGEGLGDHGEQLHNRYLYNSTIHVPLIVALDGVARPGARVMAATGHVDLMPTVLELLGVAGLDPPLDVQGRSLVPLLGGDSTALEAAPVYAETLVWSLERPMGLEVHALLDDGAKLVRTRIAPGPRRPSGAQMIELYELESDFDEQAERAAIEPERAGRLAAALTDLERRLAELAKPAETLELDEGARERLKALGYL